MSAPGTGRPVPFELAGFRGETQPALEPALHTRLLPAPEARVREGRVLRESMYRVTGRVVLEGFGAVLVKVHRSRGAVERMLSWVKPGRARAEWDAARYLSALGVPVPEPLAIGERRSGGMLETSFYVARFLEGMAPLHDVLPAQPAGKREVLLARTALLVRSLHDRDFDHRDLHAGNVLAGPGPGDACRLVVTDLHRSRYGRPVRQRAAVRGVAQWLHALQDQVDAAGRRRWIAAYRDGDDASFSAAVERRIARFERTRRRSRRKRCFKESTGYTRDVGAGLGGRARDLGQTALEEALAAHDDALARDDERVVKRGRKGSVTRHGEIVVKESHGAGGFGRVRDLLAPRRHRHGYVNAHLLRVLGVGTARPLAFLRRGGRSFTLYEDLSTLPRLDHLARRTFADGPPAERSRLLAASATWLGALHARGIYHGDLKGVNVLVEVTRDGPVFRLIDTDHCRFFDGPVDTRRRLKNLAQLAASIPVCVTRTDRLRWYRRYVQVAPISVTEREAARAVADALARKIVVTDEPIE